MEGGLIVVDASVVLAIAFGETGMDRAARLCAGAFMSSANLTETVAKLFERGWEPAVIGEFVEACDVVIVAHDSNLAFAAGALHAKLRKRGISMGDCCCLALAEAKGAKVATCDRAWTGLDFDVEVIR